MLFGTEGRCDPHRPSRRYEDHTDDMEIEFVLGCGHFIADERPDLVAERARTFFAD